MATSWPSWTWKAFTGALVPLDYFSRVGFGPFLGGLARRTIGVDRLMGFTSGVYVVTGFVVIWGTLRYFARDYERAQTQER